MLAIRLGELEGKICSAVKLSCSQLVHRILCSQPIPLDSSDRLSHDLGLAVVVMMAMVKEETYKESLFSAS